MLDAMLGTLAEPVERDTRADMIDRTVVRALSLRRRPKKVDQEHERLERSRCGFTTMLHARCDGHGRPLGFVLTPGQVHDFQSFSPLSRILGDRIEALFADKRHDAVAIREGIATAGVEAVIPAKNNCRMPIPHDRVKYLWRNLVERLFGKFKN